MSAAIRHTGTVTLISASGGAGLLLFVLLWHKYDFDTAYARFYAIVDDALSE